MDDNNASSYHVNQDNKEYIITTEVINDFLRVECEDKNLPETSTFSEAFSLNALKEMSFYFQPFDSIEQVQEELNMAIENQSAAVIINGDNIRNITFYLKNNNASDTINLELNKERNSLPQQKLKKEGNNFEFQGRCSCPLDNERIDKLEEDTSKLQNDHEYLRNEINQLIGNINMLNNRINQLKQDNAKLNQKTMELREENNSRRIEANKLRENNEAMKRQNQQLREKKNRLEFLLKEHHDPEENQFLSKTSQPSPFQPKLTDNQRAGGATMTSGIAPVMVGQSTKINRPLASRPLIISKNIYEENPTNTDFAYSKGTIIKNKSELELIVNKINKNNKKIKLDLIYKASVDSDSAKSFHYHCDNARNSVILIETLNGKRFGGYTSQSWEGDCVQKKDPNAFVFSLDKMDTYKVIPNKEAIGCYPDHGAVFLGCQIRIYDNAFKNGGTTFTKGVTYLTNEDFELSGGEKKFGIKEIEAYSVKIE